MYFSNVISNQSKGMHLLTWVRRWLPWLRWSWGRWRSGCAACPPCSRATRSARGNAILELLKVNKSANSKEISKQTSAHYRDIHELTSSIISVRSRSSSSDWTASVSSDRYASADDARTGARRPGTENTSLCSNWYWYKDWNLKCSSFSSKE